MEVNFSGINFVKTNKLGNNSTRPKNINFSANPVTFSKEAQEKSKVIQELKSCGFDDLKINKLLKKYYKTEEYNELINGEDYDGENFPNHSADLSRNLTPAEAIVYQAYNLESYYCQYHGFIPMGTKDTHFSAREYDPGKGDFSPLEMAKYLLKGYDTAISGMIAKGTIDEKEAERIAPYYDICPDNYESSLNLLNAEYTANLLDDNIEILEQLTSDETDEENKYTNGLSRPLSTEEATKFIVCDLPTDTNSINNYIAFKGKYNFGIMEMNLYNLWGKTIEQYEEEEKERYQKEVEKQKILSEIASQPETLQNKIKYLAVQYDWEDSTFLEDIMKLDNEKFGNKYSLSAIRFDKIMSHDKSDEYFDGRSRKLRQKNIEVLNSISDELLDKMAPKSFATMTHLLGAEKLDERVAQLEEFRTVNPRIFESMAEEDVLDYLINDTFYADLRKTEQEFLDITHSIMTGTPYVEPQSAKIIPMEPKNSD